MVSTYIDEIKQRIDGLSDSDVDAVLQHLRDTGRLTPVTPKIAVEPHGPPSVYDFLQQENYKRLQLLRGSVKASQLVMEVIDVMLRWCQDKGIDFAQFNYDAVLYSRFSEKLIVNMEREATEKGEYENRFTIGLGVKGER